MHLTSLPGSVITVHTFTYYEAQGQTMEWVVVRLEGCSGTEPPYAMVSHAYPWKVSLCYGILINKS